MAVSRASIAAKPKAAHSLEVLKPNRLINLYVPLITFFIFYFSPFVLNKDVQTMVITSIIFFLLTQSIRALTNRTFLILSLIGLAFIVYVGTHSLPTLDMSYVKNMITFAEFFFFLTINYVMCKGFFERNTDEAISKYTTYLAVILNLIAFYCVYEYYLKFNPVFSSFFSEDYQRYYSIDRSYELYRVSGTMQHPIVMGTFLAVGTLLNLMKFSEKKKLIYIIFSLISALSLFLTFSRSSYIALIVGFIALALFRTRKKRDNIRIPIVTAIIATFSVAVVTIASLTFTVNGKPAAVTLFERFASSQGAASMEQRTGGISYVLKSMLSSDPLSLLFGHGFGSLSFGMREANSSIFLSDFYIIDNQYFTFLYEYGVVGFVLLLGLMYYFSKRNISHKFIDEKLKLVAKYSFAMTVIIGTNIFFYEGIHWTSIAFLLSLLLALNFYVIRADKKGKIKEPADQ